MRIIFVLLFIFLSCKQKITNNDIEKKLNTQFQNIESRFKVDGLKYSDTVTNFIKICKQNNLKNVEAKATTLLADYLSKNGNLDSAIKLYHFSLNLNKENLDTLETIKSFLHLADNYAYINANKNLYFIQQAENLLKYKNNNHCQQLYYTSLGNYWVIKENYNEAKLAFENAYNIALKIHLKNHIGFTSENLGSAYNLLENYDSALFYYRKSVPYYQNDSAKLASVYNNMALCFWQSNFNDSVIYYLEKAYLVIKKYGKKTELEIAISNLIDYYEEKKETKISNNLLHELLNLKETIFNDNLSIKLASVEKDYTVKLKTQENAKLTSELKRKNTLRNAAVITAFLLGLLGLYQYRNYKQKRQLIVREKLIKDQEIEQLLKDKELKNMDALFEGREEERKRIGRDLHDRLGSMLSTVKLHFSAIETRIDDLQKEINRNTIKLLPC